MTYLDKRIVYVSYTHVSTLKTFVMYTFPVVRVQTLYIFPYFFFNLLFEFLEVGKGLYFSFIK